MKSLCVTFRWACYAFDVAPAFPSGKTDRLVYVRAPQEVPRTSSSEPVGL